VNERTVADDKTALADFALAMVQVLEGVAKRAA